MPAAVVPVAVELPVELEAVLAVGLSVPLELLEPLDPDDPDELDPDELEPEEPELDEPELDEPELDEPLPPPSGSTYC